MHPFQVPAARALVAALPALLCGCTLQPATEAVPHYEETGTVSALAKDAALLVQQRGEGAFTEFKRPNSKWFHDDTYVFVLDWSGTALCVPPDPDLEGQDLSDMTDAGGKRVAAMMRATVSGGKSAGWVHYQWPKPGETQPTWKSSYVMEVTDAAGRKRIVGSGRYNMKVDRVFLVETVDKAAELLEREGRRAFDTLRATSGAFRYQDVYVFVHDRKGTELVNPAFPHLEDKSQWDLKDANGKLIIQESIRALETRDRTWIDYMWPRPGETIPSSKHAYLRRIKVGGEDLYVGAGAYLD